MNFAEAVRNTPEIAECLKPGLQALGSNSNKVKVDATRELSGSVDIDTCLAKDYPDAPRWDYVLSYKTRVFYVEVHQGRTSEIGNILAKLTWLKQWRKRSAKLLEDLERRSSYHWVSTGKIATAFAKDRKYRNLLLKNRIVGPDAVLNPDDVSKHSPRLL